jgi:eukaryotic-like serine/threonine-protein kinase
VDRVGAVLVETYRITRLIAEGGMGDVYEAQHVRVPKKFAVKFLKGALVDKAEALARFRREAEIIATLDHPNIVTLFDYNIGEDGIPYIVLEFLDGDHLGRVIAGGALSLEHGLRIVDSVARALEAAHKLDVVHRDLKPENVILCTNGTIKVVDFGVAKLRGAAGLTAFNTTVGTVPYMSPEQILGGTLDGRTDEFALAAITFEMLTGNTCFGGGGPIPDQALRVLRHVPPPIANVPDAVNQVVQKALSKEASDRYASVSEFVAALHEAAGEVEVTPLTPAPIVDDRATDQHQQISLPPIATAVTSMDARVDFHTPTSEVDRDYLLPEGRPRITAPSMRAVETTNRIFVGWRGLSTRSLSIIAGATFGVVLALTIWLLAH